MINVPNAISTNKPAGAGMLVRPHSSLLESGTSPRPLPLQFRHDGFDFTLVRRTENVALLAKRKPTHRQTSYEVVVIQRLNACNINGREYPEREVIPRSETWGTLGWTYRDQQSALTRFQQTATARALSVSRPPPFPAIAPNGPTCGGDTVRAVRFVQAERGGWMRWRIWPQASDGRPI